MKKKTSRNSKKKRNKKPGFLTDSDVRLLRHHVRLNSISIDRTIKTIDLLINKERCPQDANTLLHLRKKFDVAVSENDTFRKVIWKHLKMVEERQAPTESLDPISFLVSRIKSRNQALIAQAAMK
jgi:hypothetical protein